VERGIVVKIGELKVDGLRGCPVPFTLQLNGRSLCLHGENGHAKTTLVDAAELWGTGDLAAFHSEGCSLTAAIHLDVSAATVEISGKGFSHRRTLSAAAGAGELEPLAPASTTDVEPIPILRHSTITGFMDSTAGQKKKALLELLGLGALNDLREPLKTTVGHAKRDADGAARELAGERAAVELQLGGERLVAYAEQQRVRAGVGGPVSSAGDVLTLELMDVLPPIPDRTGAVDLLAAAIAGVGEDSAAGWNAEIADAAVVKADGTAELLRAAGRVIGASDESCPVCGQPIVGEKLLQRLAERAAKLEEIGARIGEADKRLAALASQLGAVADAIATMNDEAPAEGWPQKHVLRLAQAAVVEHRSRIAAARERRGTCSSMPDLSQLAALLPTLREAASAASGGSQAHALVLLAELRQKCLRLRQAEQRSMAANMAYAAVTGMLALADEAIEQATRSAITQVSALAGSYYSRLVSASPITDVKLVYKPARSGQVEFCLTFDGRHRQVTPPQRIMSTSQMNALGLALHLARLKLEGQPWRSVFLDDVVNSFDAPHRQGLARLLAEEFADWQVIVLTHDRAFKDILRRTVKAWQFKDITSFSARGGPHLSEGDPRVALRARLDEGATGMEVAHIARRALEQALNTPLAKLGYDIRYDPDQRYGAHDYLVALRRGLTRAKSPLKDLPVLGRMETDGYMVNLGVHDRSDATALTTEDLYRLADDLDELHRTLRCETCNEPVWQQHRGDHGGQSFRCGCGALAA
jgi:hypothetical protein